LTAKSTVEQAFSPSVAIADTCMLSCAFPGGNSTLAIIAPPTVSVSLESRSVMKPGAEALTESTTLVTRVSGLATVTLATRMIAWETSSALGATR
jgi:hypothetical protein